MAALGDDVGGADLLGDLLAGGLRLSAMIRMAPSFLAASTADSPTAPSPTTATVSPSPTPALTAAWEPVHITSESAVKEASCSSVKSEPGTLTRVASA